MGNGAGRRYLGFNPSDVDHPWTLSGLSSVSGMPDFARLWTVDSLQFVRAEDPSFGVMLRQLCGI